MKLPYLCLVLFVIFDLSLSIVNSEVTDVSESVVDEKQPGQNKPVSTDIREAKDNKPGESFSAWNEERDVTDEKEKRFGSVLGKGFSYGKRFGSVLGNGLSYGKRFGNVLGNGMSFGKRFGTVLGNGMSFGKRYDFVLGRGYNYGKREDFGHENIVHPNAERTGEKDMMSELDNDKPAVKRNDDNSIEEDIEFVDLAGPVDEKKWVLNDIFGGGFPSYKRSKRDTRTKRYIHYFGNMLGRGFTMGKKEGKSAIDNLPEGIGSVSVLDGNSGEMDVDDHFYSAPNVPSYMFGKRQKNSDRDQRRYLGNVLGRGFSFGKRDFEANREAEHGGDYSVSDKTNKNAVSSEIDTEELENWNENFPYKRYFHSSPGYRFGKRDMEERDKRFGFILGRGLFGKRLSMPPKKKRPYGFVLGRGFSFGKRSPEYTDNVPYSGDLYTHPDLEYSPYFKKRASFVLGRGYPSGKRGDKRFGWVLGNGLSFGKRDDDKQWNPEDVSLFVDDFGNAFVRTDFVEEFDKIKSEYLDNTEARVFACTGHLIPHQLGNSDQLQKPSKSGPGPLDIKKRAASEEVSYFIDDDGNIYVKEDDISGDDEPLFVTDKDITYYTCDGHVTEILGDSVDDENIAKRGWGSVLGKGYRFGKRVGSRKRFGHILGNGFSWGK